jgi:hypothetical protein
VQAKLAASWEIAPCNAFKAAIEVAALSASWETAPSSGGLTALGDVAATVAAAG